MAMQSGLSGYTSEFGSGAMRGRFRWVETYDIDTNKSDVTIYPQFKAVSYSGYSYYFSGSYVVDGTTVVSMDSSKGSHGIYVSSRNAWLAPTVGPTSFKKSGITHNADGTKSITLQFNNVRGYTANNGGGSGWTVSGSVTISLTNIPRGSTVSATDASIGAVSTLVVNQNVSGTTHSIQYKFGSLSGYITASGGVSTTEVKFSNTTVNWTVPTSFYAQMTKTSSGQCTLTITTYQSSGTKLGDAKTASLTVSTTAARSGPTVKGTVADVNSATTALTGSSAKLVAGYSTARATITATAKNSASITARSINGTAVSSNTYVDYKKNTLGTFTFAASDSRGFSAQATVKPTVVNYIPLTVNGTCTRTSPTASTATLSLSGNFFNASFGAVTNTLTVSYKLGSGSAVSVTPTKSGNTWSASVSLSGVAYTSSYTIEVTVADKLVSLTKTITLNRGIPVFDWGASDFRFNVPVNLSGGLGQAAKDALRDFIYPVGAYYWSSSSTNPASLFGGTWTQIKDRFVLAAGDTYKVGKTGGAATHTLTANEMPAHSHDWHGFLANANASSGSYTFAAAGSSSWNAAGKEGGIQSAGGGKSHNNMPPYIVAYCWRRTA